jgi:hypothetical protein
MALATIRDMVCRFNALTFCQRDSLVTQREHTQPQDRSEILIPLDADRDGEAALKAVLKIGHQRQLPRLAASVSGTLKASLTSL